MFMPPCELSICIASYKARAYLLQCLEEVYRNPPEVSHEIIVVNDYSGDGTAEEVIRCFPEVKFAENPGPVGISKGFNMAFAQATGRYLVQLSADVLPQPGALQKLYEFMEAHPEAGMAGAQILNPDGTLQPCGRRFPTLRSVVWNKVRFHLVSSSDYFHMSYRNYDIIEEVDDMPNACLIIRRTTFNQVGGLDEELKRFYDDVEWCMRIKKAEWKIFNIPDAKVIHYWYYERAKDATHLIQTGYFSEVYLFKKHYSWLQYQSIRLVEVIELFIRMCKWSLSLCLMRSKHVVLRERLRVGWQTIKMVIAM